MVALALFLLEQPLLDRVRRSKLLQEPVGYNAAAQAHIDTLRSFVGAIGGPWLPRLPFDLQHLIGQDGDENDDEDVITIAPAQELVEALCPLRSITMQEHLPHLLPVLPQPRDDIAFFVAAPRWNPNDHGGCFDCSRIDNRIYAAFTPEYVGLWDLLHIADFPANLDVTVWAGPDMQRVEPDDQIHTFPGMLFCFLCDAAEPPMPTTLGQLLQFWSWQSPPVLPEPHFEHACCLVFSDRSRLAFIDASAPARYRREIAEITGSLLDRMRIYASAPRAMDAAINGVPCHLVLAVGDRARSYVQPPWHMALFDCRLLAQGWRAVCVFGGVIDIGCVLDDFEQLCPPWMAHLHPGRPTSVGVHFLVLMPEYAQDEDPTEHGSDAHGSQSTQPDAGTGFPRFRYDEYHTTACIAYPDLRTLLEDSVRQRGDETFFDSSTLLDVLWERVAPRVCACDVKRPDHPIDGDRSVPQLCLFDLVGTSHADVTHAPHFDVFDLDGRQCLLPGSADRVESLLCRVDLSYLGPPPVKLEQPERYDAWDNLSDACVGMSRASRLVLSSADARRLLRAACMLPHGLMSASPCYISMSMATPAIMPTNLLTYALAKAGARGGTTIGPLRFSPVNTHEELALYQWLPHICLSRSRPQEVPLLRDQVMTWSRGPGICERSPDFAMRPFMRAFPEAAPSPNEGPLLQAIHWS
ncbi:hypothetical protein AK812_SmicGene43321 [Symbiodinium microadriaticum]|uniref:Uncharacterized protein n=1 Tax=Symbiodinium microadriaticum TaxID=2951 RepID=A0A1Q9C1B4_SYMMI|nr:hypothetical protein AK812_SmicGene43321 [Symbiodinium microadriaticum]